MAARGIPDEVAEDIYAKILAFSSYGFPESHAISFAYLVYASAWLKCYYPAAFTAALLRAQPMGFYSPASLIGDVRRHGVQVRGVDVNASAVRATLEEPRQPSPTAVPDAAAPGNRDGPSPPSGGSRCRASPRSGSAWPRSGTSAPSRAAASCPASRTPVSRTSPAAPACRPGRWRRWPWRARSAASGCRGGRRCGRPGRRPPSGPASCPAPPSAWPRRRWRR